MKKFSLTKSVSAHNAGMVFVDFVFTEATNNVRAETLRVVQPGALSAEVNQLTAESPRVPILVESTYRKNQAKKSGARTPGKCSRYAAQRNKYNE